MIALDANFIIRFILGSKEDEANDLNANVSRALFNLDAKKILIPTPALSEVMVRMDQSQMIDFVQLLHRSRHFIVQSFDQASAIEAATAMRRAQHGLGKRAGSEEPWQKIKVDYQIAAISKVYGVSQIYTYDTDISKIASIFDLDVVRLENMELMPSEKQHSMVGGLKFQVQRY